MSSQHPFLTLSADHCCEIDPIKGSRFIAHACVVDSDDAAMSSIESIRQSYPDARHWCWAYQLRDQSRTRFNDDGEPSGSAGKPILAPIVGKELFDCLVVVVRYFGGVKLGVGGLVRAYSQAANAVLADADIIKVIPKVMIQLSYSYSDTSQIASALAQMNICEENIEYSDRVVSTISVIPSLADEVCSTLINYTAGKACVKIMP